MATIKSRSQELEVADGEKVQDTAEELGASFGCRHGVCGACVTRVVDGIQNLTEVTDEETSFGLGEGERMLCQCGIIGGVVTLDLD